MKGRTKQSIFHDVYQQPYTDLTRVKLYKSSKGSLDLIQRLQLVKKLPVHNGCVNSICWNETGEYILSGSDDQHLVVTHGYNYKILTDYKTSHRANIFSAKFLPSSGDNNVISCSGDGIILYTDLMRKEETFYNQFNCHSGTTYEVITIPNDPHSFLSCGEDGTVRWFDLRIKDKCTKPQCKEDILISCQRAVTALSVNPMAPYQLAIGCSDSTVRMFDRRMLTTKASGGIDTGAAMRPLCSFTVPNFEKRSYRITSLCFSPEGEEILVSYSSDHLYLFSVKEHGTLQLKAGVSSEELHCDEKGKKIAQRSPPPVRRLRLRGDWSDTGPDARPEREGGRRGEVAQARPTLHATLMQRMTDVLSRMLNDPATRAALSGGGEDSLEGEEAPPPTSTENSVPTVNQDAATSRTDNDSTAENAVASEVTSNNSPASISVPQFSSLSIHSSVENDISGASSSSTQRISEVSLPSGVSSVDNALDLTHVPPIPDSSNSESNEHESTVPRTCEPSSSSSDSASHSLGTAISSSIPFPPNLESIKNKISTLQDRLSSMRDGFIERHGSEPAVRLTYTDRGSTSATISLGVGDEVSRELHPETSSLETNASVSAIADDEPSQNSSTHQEVPDYCDCGPGPSYSNNQTESAGDAAFDGEDDYNDSDEDDEDEMLMPTTRRFIHPIEEHMDEAIAAAHHDKEIMFDEPAVLQPSIKQKFTGHRNARTMIKEATFWGDGYILSGSDCGHVFIWDRYTGTLVMLLEADRHVVNCLQPHPVLPLLATSGIDYDVKLWAPLHEEPNFDRDLADILTKRNEIMLEETKDTITVPASFMIRMLACLNQIRRGGRNRNRNSRRQNAGEDTSASN
ncbi:DDB1- and CUL4-associated factor 6 isoform X2 [Anabrus simplex]|uniref:DDB1- and CUL4-associated factor 6 isoform X2 n=1 Tax=Anabrus simplex TaxID=316456 RepID=UPI0034DCDEEC